MLMSQREVLRMDAETTKWRKKVDKTYFFVLKEKGPKFRGREPVHYIACNTQLALYLSIHKEWKVKSVKSEF